MNRPAARRRRADGPRAQQTAGADRYRDIVVRPASAMLSALGSSASCRSGLAGIRTSVTPMTDRRAVELVPAVIDDPADHLPAEAAGHIGLMDDEQTAARRESLPHRLEVQRREPAQIDDGGVDPVGPQDVAGSKAEVHPRRRAWLQSGRLHARVRSARFGRRGRPRRACCRVRSLTWLGPNIPPMALARSGRPLLLRRLLQGHTK